MGFLSSPPSLASLNARELKELQSIIRKYGRRYAERFSDKLGKLQTAMDLAERMQRFVPSSLGATQKEAARRAADYHAAVLELAWPDNPRSFVVPYKLCEFYSCIDRFEDALLVAQVLFKRFPNEPRASYALATVYHTLARLRESELTLEMKREVLSPEWDASSEAIEQACKKLGLTMLQASELAAQFFGRTLELDIRQDERPHVEECLQAALGLGLRRKSGNSLGT